MKKELMSWEECCKGYLRRVEADNDKVISMLKMCKVRLKVISQIRLDEETASVMTEDFYEIIKELLIALMLIEKLKSDNHECLIAFFKKNFPEKEYELKIIYELKNLRNKINYEGLFVDQGYIKQNKLEFMHIIGFLNKEIEERLKNS